jgi:glycosyltransferase involved in cell wall biosynthesis
LIKDRASSPCHSEQREESKLFDGNVKRKTLAKKRLVIFTGNKTTGGAERFTILTAQDLFQHYDWEVSLLCGGWANLDAWCKEFEAIGGTVSRQNYHDLPRWLLKDLPKAVKLIRQADVVQVNITDQIGKINILGVLLCWLLRRPAILSERLVITPEERGHAVWSIRLWRVLARLYHRLASGIVAISESDKKILTEYYKTNPTKIRLIPVGIDENAFKPELREHAKAIKTKFGISETAPILICTSRLLPEKGHHFLVAAAPTILNQFPEAHFVIVGEGEAKTALLKQVEDLNLSANFTFTGNLPPDLVAKSLAAAEVAVFPSLRESVSRAACEAVFSGTPLIATDVGSMRQVIENGKTGWIVPPEDVSALTKAVIEVLSDPVRSRAMAEEARLNLLKTQSLSHTIALTDEFYRSMARGYTPTGGLRQSNPRA